ncbi:helix-turn-helix domain-containing protein [Antarcticimicrobium luteum]|uniref:XRE family transcriptional regulator n=1 Tax=Antarcticimicrobium luteum TaxID=2547397 RepID=A0A4R5VFS5_9RHOB|nr:helix-turn-helix transcriptional regulator [Antarcticimicrobium luteum]TDK51154.1 XRE family transcriptional regulator [Antarcticimicrobium luteum]
MDYLEIERICRRGDTSPEAIHKRLVAARLMTGMSQKELAENAGIKYTTFRSQEQSGAPSVRLMSYFLSAFQVDFNFILGGDPARLPADVLREIAKHLD